MQYKAPEHFADDGDSDSDEDEDSEKQQQPSVKYEKPADVYSFGMMCWEIFSGKVPFAGKTDIKIMNMHNKASRGGKVKRPSLDDISKEVAPVVVACWSQDPSARPTFREIKEMLGVIGIISIPDALNSPGFWDVIISHSRRCAAAVTLATEAATWFESQGMTVWLDVRMSDRSTAAMEEGVKNSKYFVAVVSGPCINNDQPNDPPEGNSYFRREYCVKEIRWGQEADKFIQPILRLEDKGKIGEFLSLLDAPLRVDGTEQDVSDLKKLGTTDWIDLNRNDNEYWNLGMKKVLRALVKGEERMKQARQQRRASEMATAGETRSSSSTVETSSVETSSVDRAQIEREVEKRMKQEKDELEAEFPGGPAPDAANQVRSNRTEAGELGGGLRGRGVHFAARHV